MALHHLRLAGVAAGTLLLAGCRSTSSAITGPGPLTKCAVELSASATTFDADGGRGQLTVSTDRDCRWSASTSTSWLTLANASEQQGAATFEFTVAKNDVPTARTGSIAAADKSLQITQRAATCRFNVSATNVVLAAAGGGADVDVTASNESCEWTARAEADWLAIKAGSTGRGAGRVTFEAGAYAGPARTTRVTVADQLITVTQRDGCVYTLAPASASLPAGGGTGSTSIAAASGCGWSATSGTAWLTITNGASSSGAGTVEFSATANSGPARTGTLTIAGHAFVVSQASGCTFGVAPASVSFAATAGSASVSVTAAGGCSWTAASEASWLTVASGAAGAGPGAVQLSAAGNVGPQRSTALRIAEQIVNVTQANGCTYSISPVSASFPAAGGTGSTAVSTVAGCPWTAASAATWLSVTSGSSGAGPGTVSFAVAPSVFEPRTGTITIAANVFTASQDRGCVVSLSATSASFGPEGGTGGFMVYTQCPWRTLVESGADWVTLTRGDRGNADGPVTFIVAPNDGPPRTATLLVEDHDRFTINQAGR